ADIGGVTLRPDRFDELLGKSGWSLDAWIQQSLNRHIDDGGTEVSFVERLRGTLYRKLLDAADGVGVRGEVGKALDNVQRLDEEELSRVSDFFDHYLAGTTVYSLSTLFANAPDEKLPSAVINFNADILFEDVFNVMAKLRRIKETGHFEDPTRKFRRVVRSNLMPGGSIPIYHLHGCLLPIPAHNPYASESPEGMVFPENSYTALA